MKTNERLKVQTLSDIDNLMVHGRTTRCLSHWLFFGQKVLLN
ncbi:hypothetical protein J2T13_001285 [Paenibacillus sp. DS2015]